MMNPHLPLAEKLRPESLDQVVGQDHLLGENGLIRRIIQEGKPLSIILWGPPGSGKTSIARLYAKAFKLPFKTMSAVFSGIAEIKQIVKEGESLPLFQSSVVLFVDEIHRFNKAQQDAFLPYIEKGTIILIGATAENPSFYLNNALLSRVRVLTLKSLDEEALEKILKHYESHFASLPLTSEARQYLIQVAQGDGRYLLNMIENISSVHSKELFSPVDLEQILQRRSALFDKGDDKHYDLISALHKSVRGSDPDAALYWLARLLEGGEAPLFIARRLIRMASEDIGLADPQALQQALFAWETYEKMGSPEGELALAQAVIYLALAPKSNAIYTAYKAARESASQTTHLNPPKIILNAPTRLMKEEGYGKGYIYDHDTPQGFSGQMYFPDELAHLSFYQPVNRGFEREMSKRMDYFRKLREKN
jgi:putative ATPase